MRNSCRASFSSVPGETEAGSITLPSLLLIVVLVGAMTACLGIALLWRSKVGIQLRLDRCVEKTSLSLTSIQSQIEASNLRMKAERAAAVAAAIPSGGSSLKAAQAVLEAEMIFQEILRGKWRVQQGTWIAERGCDRKGDAFFPLPSLEWWRPPNDAIGPQPLEWKGSKEKGLAIRLWNSNRYSFARVSTHGSRSLAKWNAGWEPAIGGLR